MTLRKKLPSAQSLFAFESAARTLNFTDAGALLNVTQPAISKNIAALEAHLGTRLFLRAQSELSFIADGVSLYRAVQLSDDVAHLQPDIPEQDLAAILGRQHQMIPMVENAMSRYSTKFSTAIRRSTYGSKQ
jgi:predicted transcriptional regulator